MFATFSVSAIWLIYVYHQTLISLVCSSVRQMTFLNNFSTGRILSNHYSVYLNTRNTKCYWWLTNVTNVDDSFNAGIGSRTAQDPFFSNSFNHPVNNININNLGSFNNGVSGASRSVSTTTSIVNGRKHTVTKIQDMNVSSYHSPWMKKPALYDSN